LDQPLPLEPSSDAAQAAGLGVGPVEDALSCAMQTGKPIAAIAAAEILGQIGDEQLLASTGGQPRPLAMALRHSDRRLRLAAAQAILKIDPKQPYAGSSYLPETLGYILQTIGARRVLVVNPRVTHAQNLVGLLAEIGFVADTAATGREAFRRAADSADYEFALISDVTDFPNARETAQMLRKDPRTHGLPIGMLAREETLKQAEDFARSDPRMRAFPRPADAEGMAFRAAEILELAKQDLVGHSVRLAQARTAVDQLTRLAGSSEYAFYDLYRQIPAAQSALATPELSVQAAVLLGLLGSRNSQLSLVDLASQTLRPLAERQAAARGFATAVGKHGVLLTRDEILLQYQRYNQSENLDRGTQQVLASILDAIEGESRSADAQSKPSAQDASAS
jgi:CheY-like chemotaxis protein